MYGALCLGQAARMPNYVAKVASDEQPAFAALFARVVVGCDPIGVPTTSNLELGTNVAANHRRGAHPFGLGIQLVLS